MNIVCSCFVHVLVTAIVVVAEHCKNRPVMVTTYKGYNQLQKVILT